MSYDHRRWGEKSIGAKEHESCCEIVFFRHNKELHQLYLSNRAPLDWVLFLMLLPALGSFLHNGLTNVDLRCEDVPCLIANGYCRNMWLIFLGGMLFSRGK